MLLGKSWVKVYGKFNIYQSQLSGSWCLVWPTIEILPRDRFPVEWYDTWQEAWEAYGIAVRQLSSRY